MIEYERTDGLPHGVPAARRSTTTPPCRAAAATRARAPGTPADVVASRRGLRGSRHRPGRRARRAARPVAGGRRRPPRCPRQHPGRRARVRGPSTRPADRPGLGQHAAVGLRGRCPRRAGHPGHARRLRPRARAVGLGRAPDVGGRHAVAAAARCSSTPSPEASPRSVACPTPVRCPSSTAAPPATRAAAARSAWPPSGNGSTPRASTLPPGPVLLVDDLVDSRWTITVAARELRRAGAPAVLPFALALRG